MPFEWDPRKDKSNIQKHHLSFEETQTVFDQQVITLVDNRKNYGEIRKISIGTIRNTLVVVIVHVNRNGRTRIISARIANNKERKLFYAHFQ